MLISSPALENDVNYCSPLVIIVDTSSHSNLPVPKNSFDYFLLQRAFYFHLALLYLQNYSWE